MEEVRGKVVAFTRSHYEKHGVSPTISLICEKVGLSRKELYRIFPEGQAGICGESGIPVPKARMERTRRATKRRVRKAERRARKGGGGARSETPAPLLVEPYRLTKEQVDRFRGLLHLEPERKDIRSVIDTWLGADAELRVRHGMKTVDEIGKAVELAKKVDEMGTDMKQLVVSHFILEQVGISDLDQLKTLARFLKHMTDDGWEIKEIADYVTVLSLCGVGTKFSKEDIYTLAGLYGEADRSGKNLKEYVDALCEERDRIKGEVADSKAEIESLRAERDQLMKEIDELKRRKERVAEDLRFYEEAKNKRVRELTKAHPWTKQREARMREELKSTGSGA